MTDRRLVTYHRYELVAKDGPGRPGAPTPTDEEESAGPRPGAVTLAVRTWDSALGVPVHHGLTVTARRADGRGRPAMGIHAAIGTHVFYEPELGCDCIVDVWDGMGRFFPSAYRVTGSMRGVAQPAPITLLSAPTREAIPGLSVLRGDLIEHSETLPFKASPARLAVVEVGAGDDVQYGVSDERGCFAVFFPEPVAATLAGTATGDYRCKLPVRVRYSGTEVLPQGLRGPFVEELKGQPVGRIHPTLSDPDSAVAEWECLYSLGEQLVVQTDDLRRLVISRSS